MWTPDYFLRYVDFPPGVEGVTVPNSDGTFDIYINARLGETRRQECLEHELRHIRRDHFYSGGDVETLEAEAGGRRPRFSRLTLFDHPSPTHIPLFPSLDALGDYLALIESALSASASPPGADFPVPSGEIKKK